jgi:hypothetical protein
MVYFVMNTNTKYYDFSELNYLIVLDSSILFIHLWSTEFVFLFQSFDHL